jgi:FMN reductase
VSRARIVSVVGNPRPASRTHGIAREMAAAIASELGTDPGRIIDLAPFGPRTLAADDAEVGAAVQHVLEADVLVVASPTYKATYSGLLKAFLDRLGTGSLNGAGAVPMLLGGAPNHQLAVDVHFTPLLLELGASVPGRGLFVLESEIDVFAESAAAWARRHAWRLVAPR